MVVAILRVLGVLLVLQLSLLFHRFPLLFVLMKSMLTVVGFVLVAVLFLPSVLSLLVLVDEIPLPSRPEPPRLRFGSFVLGLLEGACCELGLVLASHSDPGTSGCLLGVCSSSRSFGKTSLVLECRCVLEPKSCGLLAGRDCLGVVSGAY
jgi:hypothetical protein